MNASTPLSPLLKPLLGLALLLALTGCATQTSAVDRLMAHPEFRYAAQAAPHFTSDALKTIANLEAAK